MSFRQDRDSILRPLRSGTLDSPWNQRPCWQPVCRRAGDDVELSGELIHQFCAPRIEPAFAARVEAEGTRRQNSGNVGILRRNNKRRWHASTMAAPTASNAEPGHDLAGREGRDLEFSVGRFGDKVGEGLENPRADRAIREARGQAPFDSAGDAQRGAATSRPWRPAKPRLFREIPAFMVGPLLFFRSHREGKIEADQMGRIPLQGIPAYRNPKPARNGNKGRSRSLRAQTPMTLGGRPIAAGN